MTYFVETWLIVKSNGEIATPETYNLIFRCVLFVLYPVRYT